MAGNVRLQLTDGTIVHLDRNLRTSEVVKTVNEARGKGQLIPFQNNATPSRETWIDPDHVVRVYTSSSL